MYLDSAGRASGDPTINRTIEFEDAKFFLREFFFDAYNLYFNEFQRHGKAPFNTSPYCMEFISIPMHLVELSRASSLFEAGLHAENIAGELEILHITIQNPGEIGGSYNKQFCDKFESEKREILG